MVRESRVRRMTTIILLLPVVMYFSGYVRPRESPVAVPGNFTGHGRTAHLMEPKPGKQIYTRAKSVAVLS